MSSNLINARNASSNPPLKTYHKTPGSNGIPMSGVLLQRGVTQKTASTARKSASIGNDSPLFSGKALRRPSEDHSSDSASTSRGKHMSAASLSTTKSAQGAKKRKRPPFYQSEDDIVRSDLVGTRPGKAVGNTSGLNKSQSSTVDKQSNVNSNSSLAAVQSRDVVTTVTNFASADTNSASAAIATKPILSRSSSGPTIVDLDPPYPTSTLSSPSKVRTTLKESNSRLRHMKKKQRTVQSTLNFRCPSIPATEIITIDDSDDDPSPATAPRDCSPAAAPQEPSPAAAPQEPSPAATPEEPSPAAAPQDPSPAAVRQDPSPAAARQDPSPAAATQNATPQPSTPVALVEAAGEAAIIPTGEVRRSIFSTPRPSSFTQRVRGIKERLSISEAAKTLGSASILNSERPQSRNGIISAAKILPKPVLKSHEIDFGVLARNATGNAPEGPSPVTEAPSIEEQPQQEAANQLSTENADNVPVQSIPSPIPSISTSVSSQGPTISVNKETENEAEKSLESLNDYSGDIIMQDSVTEGIAVSAEKEARVVSPSLQLSPVDQGMSSVAKQEAHPSFDEGTDVRQVENGENGEKEVESPNISGKAPSCEAVDTSPMQSHSAVNPVELERNMPGARGRVVREYMDLEDKYARIFREQARLQPLDRTYVNHDFFSKCIDPLLIPRGKPHPLLLQILLSKIIYRRIGMYGL
ncbi:hypothetical protein BGX38DRAFT_523318 [Terfezia claveryi]|nr:hypothetical protein BGX38DRAFT_523318 [Terfezia claveryi]